MQEAILKAVCKKYEVSDEQIKTRSGRRHCAKVVEAKQVAAYLLWRYTKLSGREIGTELGNPSKQYVYDILSRIKKIRSANKAFKQELLDFEKVILRD